jgi:uncharacterized metal-binding protein
MAKSGKAKKNNTDLTLTDNKKANMLLLSLDASFLSLLFLLGILKIGDLANFQFSSKSLSMNIIVYLSAYVFASHWFSPDLDIRVNRPGKGSFPFGALLKLSAKGVRGGFWPFVIVSKIFLTIFGPLHSLLNRIWYYFWQPFSFLVTHRGAIHLPFYGTACKIFYLSSGIYIVLLFLKMPILDSFFNFNLMTTNSFLAWNKLVWNSIFGGGLLTTAVCAVVVSDIKHIAVDWYDTIRKGTSFVPPPAIAPRGLLVLVLSGLFLKK